MAVPQEGKGTFSVSCRLTVSKLEPDAVNQILGISVSQSVGSLQSPSGAPAHLIIPQPHKHYYEPHSAVEEAESKEGEQPSQGTQLDDAMILTQVCPIPPMLEAPFFQQSLGGGAGASSPLLFRTGFCSL